MRALRLAGPGDISLADLPAPRPGPGEALVAVTDCGVCGSDLHFLDGTARTAFVPITLGHEIAGAVIDGGGPGLAPGTAVVVALADPCGACPRCDGGRPNLCERAAVPGIHRDGGLADLVAVPAGSLVPIPAGVSPTAAATAVDAGATAFHAVSRRAAVRSGETVLVVGVGGLGSFAVQFARMAGAAAVIAADTDPAALQRAADLGATATVLVEPGSSLGRQIRSHTSGGVDVALEFVGRASTVDAAVKSLRPGGRAVAAGVGPEPLVTVPPVLWSNHEYALLGSYGSMPGDAATVLDGLASGDLRPPPVIPATLDDAVAALRSLATGGTGGGRLVVRP